MTLRWSKSVVAISLPLAQVAQAYSMSHIFLAYIIISGKYKGFVWNIYKKIYITSEFQLLQIPNSLY